MAVFHENGILKKTIAPAILNDAIKDELKLKTKKPFDLKGFLFLVY